MRSTRPCAGWIRPSRVTPLSPAVRRAKLRLLAAATMRHLKQRKPHLVEKDLAQLEALPQAAEGDRPAFLDAARWLAGALAGEAGETQEARRTELIRRLGSEAAADVFLSSLAEAGGLKGVRKLGPPDLPEGVSLPQAVGRALALGDDLNLSLSLPVAWEAGLIKVLERSGPSIEPPPLRTLAEAALRDGRIKLAMAASGAGLARGGPSLARFLLLRARSIDPWEMTRRSDLFLAAITLARRQRDSALVREAIDAMRAGEQSTRFAIFDDFDDLTAARSTVDMDPAHLERVLDSERGKRKRVGNPHLGEYFIDCPCQECRIARGELKRPAPPTHRIPDAAFPGADDEEDGDEDAAADGGPINFKVLREILEVLARTIGGAKADAMLQLLEDVKKYVRPDGTLPSADEISRKDPALGRRIEEVLAPPGGGGDYDDDDPYYDDDYPPPRQNTKTQRKRRTKKHKK